MLDIATYLPYFNLIYVVIITDSVAMVEVAPCGSYTLHCFLPFDQYMYLALPYIFSFCNIRGLREYFFFPGNYFGVLGSKVSLICNCNNYLLTVS